MGKQPELLYYENEVMYRVSPIARTVEHFFAINCLIGPGSVQKALFIGRNEVFMILKNCTSAYEDEPYYATFKSALFIVPGCREDRLACALLYDPFRSCLYVFGGQGGFLRSDSQDSKVCERLLLLNYSSQRLPDMLEPRSAFGVCWHMQLGYICGGTRRSVESFNPEMQAFRKICDFDEELSNILAFSHQGSIYLLNQAAIWKGKSGKFTKNR